MSTSPPDDTLPPAADGRLTHLLARWGDAHRLTPADAAAMRRAVLAVPAEPGDEWWPAFMEHFMTALTSAVGNAGPGVAGLPVLEHVLFSGGSTSWPAAMADYRPYLRLAAAR